MKTKKKKSLRRELIEWGVFFGVLIFLYASGLHTTVFGGIQNLFLKTGFLSPSMLAENEQQPASYALPLTDMEGNAVAMETLKGKVIFLNFWATWCPPCIAEMPEIAALHASVSEADVAFVMVSVDKDEAKLKAFLAKKKYAFPVYRLSGRIPEPYQAQSIPTTYVISPKGKIVVEKVGMGSYNTDGFRRVLQKAKSY